MTNNVKSTRPTMWVRSCRLVEHKLKPRGYRLAGDQHPGHELVYVDFGYLRVSLAGRTVELEAGDCLLVPSRQTHRYAAQRGLPMQFLNVVYYGRLPAQLSGNVIRVGDEQRDQIAGIRNEVAVEREHAELMIIAKLNELLISLYRERNTLIRQSKLPAANRQNHQQTVVARTLAWLEQHYARPLNLQALSRHTQVSIPHLRTLVRVQTNMSIQSHQVALRMAAARRLLMTSPASVKLIAHTVGYQSVPHFCNRFKAHFDMTPSEFARSLGEPTHERKRMA